VWSEAPLTLFKDEDFIMQKIAESIRSYMVESMAMQHAEFLELDDELELDSLAQTEIRIFIEGEYKVPVGFDDMKPEVTETLNSLVSYIDKQIKQNDTNQAA